MNDAPSPSYTPFRLLRWFCILGALSIVSITVICALFLSRFLSSTVVWHDAQLMTQFLNSIVRVERAQPFFVTNGKAGGGQDIERFLHHISGLPGVLKVNAYGLNKSTIWSSDEEMIGRNFPDNDDLHEAMNGRPVISFGISGGNEKREHVFFDEDNVRFVENYLPVWMPGQEGSLVIGAIEVYRRPTRLFDALSDSTRQVWTAAGLAAALMCGILFWLAWRTTQAIERQHRELVRAESLANMGEMASVMAHGLRNPLASIRSSAELGIEVSEERQVKSLFTEVVGLADRIESWVRQYLSYVRPSDDSAHAVDVASIISDCLDAYAAQLSRRDIEVSLDIADALPPCAVNPVIVGQAINSVLANAVEAIGEQGRVTISAGIDRVAKRVRIAIADDGPGMTHRDKDRAFEPFVTSKSAGMGLGLPLTREALNRNGASLDIESEVGRGTTASIGLPVAA